MQHAGLQYGQGAANSHQSPPFAHTDISQAGGGNTTSSLRQFRKKDGVEKPPGQDLTTSITENSHIARVPPHNHYPARPNDYYRYHPQYPDFSTPYKETTQVKYSEIAEPPQQHVDHLVPIQKHKEKEFMDMCNISQQTHMKQNYPDNLNRQQSYPPDASVHHQYHHKEPQVHNYKPESQYQQYPQLGKYNMPSQCRKYTTPPENDFLAKLQRLHPSMARSIMSDHHIRESQTYPPMDQSRIYSQNQRYYPPIQNNSYNYHTMPQYNYPTSCNYKHPGDYSRQNQIGGGGARYPTITPHPERSISPRRNYPENLTLPMNYGNVPQKISANYPQYNPPEYAQHYQHRRAAVPQEYYQQSGRPTQFISGHQISPESTDNRGSSSGLRHYLENWAEEEATAEIGEPNKYMYKDRLHDDATNEPVYVINSSDIPPQCLESLSLVPTENGQYIIKSGALDNSVVRIVDKDNNIDNSNERTVNLQMVETTNKTDCMLESGGKSNEDGGEKNDNSEVVDNNKESQEPQPPPPPLQNLNLPSPAGRDPNDNEDDQEKEDEEETFEIDDKSLTKQKVKMTISTEDNEIVERTVEVMEKTSDTSVSVGFREIDEKLLDDDGITKDMPIIEEENAKEKRTIGEENECEDGRGEEIATSPPDDTSVIEELIEEIVETKINKRTQRIFSVDDIMNNIGNHCSNQTRRSSLQPTKDFASNVEDNQSNNEETTTNEDETFQVTGEDPQKTDEVDEEIQAIFVEDSSVILELGGALVKLNINYFNGNKVLTVLPLSESLIIDVNGNYANWDQDNNTEIDEEKSQTLLPNEAKIESESEELVLEESITDSEMDTSVYESEVVIGEEIPASEILLDFNDNKEKEEIITSFDNEEDEETDATPSSTIGSSKKNLPKESFDEKVVAVEKKSRTSLDKELEIEEKKMRKNSETKIGMSEPNEGKTLRSQVDDEETPVQSNERTQPEELKLVPESTNSLSRKKDEVALESSENEEVTCEDFGKSQQQISYVASRKPEDEIVLEKLKKQEVVTKEDFETFLKVNKPATEVAPSRRGEDTLENSTEQEVVSKENFPRSRKLKKSVQVATNRKVDETPIVKLTKPEANSKEENEKSPKLKKPVVVFSNRKEEVKVKKQESKSKEDGEKSPKLKKSITVSPTKREDESVVVKLKKQSIISKQIDRTVSRNAEVDNGRSLENEAVVEKLKKQDSTLKVDGEKSPKMKKIETPQIINEVEKTKKNETVPKDDVVKSPRLKNVPAKDNQTPPVKLTKSEESRSSKLRKIEIEDDIKSKWKRDDVTRSPKTKKLDQSIQDDPKPVKKMDVAEVKKPEEPPKQDDDTSKVTTICTKAAKKLYTSDVKKLKIVQGAKSKNEEKSKQHCRKIDVKKSMSKLEETVNKIKSMREKSFENATKTKKSSPKKNEETSKKPEEIPQPPPPETVDPPPIEEVERKKLKPVKRVSFNLVTDIKEIQEETEELHNDRFRLKDLENNRKRLSWEEYSSRKRKSDCRTKKVTSSSQQTVTSSSFGIDDDDDDVSIEKVELSIENEINKTNQAPPTPPPISISANNCWEEEVESPVTPESREILPNNPQLNRNSKCIIDVNEFNIRPMDSSPVSSSQFSEDDSLQVYKEVVDSKLNSLNIQIPKVTAKPKPVETNEETTSKKISVLIQRFLSKGTLNCSELESVKKIIEYKRRLEEEAAAQKKKQSTYEVRGQRDYDDKDLKLHIKKVQSDETTPTKRKRKRFRNLYTDENSDDDDDESDSSSTKIGDYSVYQRNSQGVPKLIFKRKSGLPEPFVKLERSQAVDLMAKKRKLY